MEKTCKCAGPDATLFVQDDKSDVECPVCGRSQHQALMDDHRGYKAHFNRLSREERGRRRSEANRPHKRK